MKKTAALWALGLATLVGCQEVGPEIILSNGTPSTDTTYLAPVESPQARSIVIEEATGMHCSNCPGGAAAIAGIIQNHPDRVVAVGMHYATFAEPFEWADVDLRSEAARDLFNYFGGEPAGKPAAAVDRVPKDGDLYLYSTTDWIAQANARLNVATTANVQLSSVWKDEDSSAQVTVRIAFTQPQTRTVKLTVGLTESNIVAPQLDGLKIDTSYTHKHVLREMLTPASGQLLLDGQAIEAGRVYQRTFTYKPNASWDPAHCEVFAVVHYSDQQGKEVVQAAQAALK